MTDERSRCAARMLAYVKEVFRMKEKKNHESR